MFNNKENYLFVVLVLTFGLFNANIVAQDESADEDVEEVVVTGSRVNNDELVHQVQLQLFLVMIFYLVVMQVLMSI